MADKEKKTDGDPRVNILGRAIEDDFARIRENYGIFALLVLMEERN
jgi:triacylglycerol lipase